jgi:hypothetical protein
LNRFDVIGVTEKELGNSVLDRVRNLATLRTLLDDNGVRSPIHIFGGLDPLAVILYYVAGAEIFDGLTWLRYGFVDGVAVYRENFNVLKTPLDLLPPTARSHMLTSNLAQLQRLAHSMREYQHTGDIRVFAPHERIVEQVTRQIALGARK